MAEPAAPRRAYQARLRARKAVRQTLERRDGQLSNIRLGVFGVVLIAIGAWLWIEASPIWIGLALITFVGLVFVHERVVQRSARTQRAISYYELGIRRIEHQWMGDGNQRTDYVGSDHPYAADLDLFGPGSLFELMCTARTRAGEVCLASWLTAPADVETVRRRQSAVEDLRARLDLREDLALAGADVRADVDPEALTRWGQKPPRLAAKATLALRATAIVLPTICLATALTWALEITSPLPFFGVLLLIGLAGRVARDPVRDILGAVGRPARELEVLTRVLRRLESEQFSDGHLQQLRTRLASGHTSAATSIARLHRLFGWQEASHNQVFAPIGFALMWNVHFAVAIERWRKRHGPEIGDWLEALGELEALGALATYAFEHPHDPFPTIVDGPPRIEGQALGHPLIAETECVRNPVMLDPDTRLLVISGSNMSGKSTYLRTVGINLVLALAGAPVRAEQFTASYMRIGATLRIQDSLQRGASRFFAEISRLRELMRAAEQAPLLVLLDEILHGTNSHDRRIGAEALLRGFLDRGAIGMVTTHDLTLAEIADNLAPVARNVHFADTMKHGRIHFDYEMRDGVVRHSNAIPLMRSIGLDV